MSPRFEKILAAQNSVPPRRPDQSSGFQIPSPTEFVTASQLLLISGHKAFIQRDPGSGEFWSAGRDYLFVEYARNRRFRISHLNLAGLIISQSTWICSLPSGESNDILDEAIHLPKFEGEERNRRFEQVTGLVPDNF